MAHIYNNPPYPSEAEKKLRKDPTTFEYWQFRSGSRVWGETYAVQYEMWKRETLEKETK